MKKIIIATALATMMSGTAFAQVANQNAPQPSSDGRGVNIPGTTTTGAAVDRPDSNQAQEDANMRRKTVKSGMSKDGMATSGTSRDSMSK